MTESSLTERARTLFQSRYDIQRELGSGVTGALFEAQDRVLKRKVAVKVLHPELGTDQLSRRFLREARILASLTHPNIVAIHEAGEAGGLPYYVRDFLDGESLAARLVRGRMSAAEAESLCRDLLAALGVVHRSGVIHRDLRPHNVFRLGDRFVLADFEVARPASLTTASDTTGPPRSASGYGAPEQLTGGEVSARSDIYMVGVLVYEALTGRRWISGAPPARAGWSGVPRRFRPVLARALAPKPSERWPDALSFAAALDQAESRTASRRPWVLAGAAIALLGIAAAGYRTLTAADEPEFSPRELAVLPLESDGGSSDDSLGAGVAQLVWLNLENLPGLSLTPSRQTSRWWERQQRTLIGVDKARAVRDLRVHWLTHGVLERRGDSLRVRLTVYDGAGRKTPIPEVRSQVGDLGVLGDTLSVSLVRAIAPQLAGSYRIVGDLGSFSFGALRAFLRGEAAFQRDAWALAEQNFGTALQLDSSFALAAWRLANVKRWRRLPYEDDLRRLYERPDARLRPLDRELIAALRETGVRGRLERLDSVIARFPDDAYARLLFAEELFHRGPLVGRGLEEGTRAMADAILRDSSLALAYDHLVFSAIRRGDRAEAKRRLHDRRRVATARSPGDPDVAAFAALAFDERFAPRLAALKRRYIKWNADPAQFEGVARVFRTGVPWFDIPQSQLALAGLLLQKGGSGSRASAYEGRALALMNLGRPGAAFGQLDSATRLFNTDTARLEHAQWRVILPALGLPVSAEPEWVDSLESLVSDSSVGGRAAWALGLRAYSRGDSLNGRRWAEQLRSRSDGRELGRFLAAVQYASGDQWKAALALSDSLEVPLNLSQPADPFARAAFHILRGLWYFKLGEWTAADHEWLWYEGSDVEGWPGGLAQAGEVDGMLSVYARLLRARALVRSDAPLAQREAGCALLQRAGELWADAEPSFTPLIDQSKTLTVSCSP